MVFIFCLSLKDIPHETKKAIMTKMISHDLSLQYNWTQKEISNFRNTAM